MPLTVRSYMRSQASECQLASVAVLNDADAVPRYLIPWGSSTERDPDEDALSPLLVIPRLLSGDKKCGFEPYSADTVVPILSDGRLESGMRIGVEKPIAYLLYPNSGGRITVSYWWGIMPWFTEVGDIWWDGKEAKLRNFK